MSTHKGQQQQRSIKTTHSLASPFLEASWPQIHAADQQTILDLLCILLGDLGQYHRSLVISTGKRRKRDKCKEENDVQQKEAKDLSRPEIRSHLLIGFNEVQRHLETKILERSRVSRVLQKETLTNTDDSMKSSDADNSLLALFVDRSSQPLIMTRHLPNMMAAAASKDSTLWLIPLPNGGGTRLGEIAGIPRLGFCGLLAKAPGSIPLMHYIKEHIQPIQSSITDTLLSTSFLPLKVDTYSIEIDPKLSGTKNRRQRNVAPDGNDEPYKSKKRRKRRCLDSQQA